MQVNSAQDYLTAQKRRIIASTFAATPPPAQRKYNFTYLSVLANKATQYNKVPYPQTVSLAAGAVPGGVYSAGTLSNGRYSGIGAQLTTYSQATRPNVSDCVNCATTGTVGTSTLPGSLI
jgi:hypothetical protein